MPVPTFFSVTVAPGTTAPVESRTVPSTLAVSNCAYAAAGGRRIATITTSARRRTDLCRNMESPWYLAGVRTASICEGLAVKRRRFVEPFPAATISDGGSGVRRFGGRWYSEATGRFDWR